MPLQILDHLDQLEEQILDSIRIPFTSNRLLNEQETLDLLQELRETIPTDVEEAVKIVRKSREIISNSQLEADEIINQAKIKKQELIKSTTIYQEAEDYSKTLIHKTNTAISEKNKHARANIDKLYQEAQQYLNVSKSKSMSLEIDAKNNRFEIIRKANAESLAIKKEAIMESVKEMNRLTTNIEKIKDMLTRHASILSHKGKDSESIVTTKEVEAKDENILLNKAIN